MDDGPFDHAASHLGKAVGMANLLRGTAYHAARCALPDPCEQKTPSQAMCTAPGHSSSDRTLPLSAAVQQQVVLHELCGLLGAMQGPLQQPLVNAIGRPERRMLGCTAIRITGDQPSIALCMRTI